MPIHVRATMPSLGRVLLIHFPAERAFRGFANADGSPRPTLLGMVLEELVSLSVSEILMPSSARPTVDEQAPLSLRRRISFVDLSQARAKRDGFFAEIADEFAVTFEHNVGVRSHPPALPKDVRDALSFVYLVSTEYFAAIDHRAQTQLPLVKTRRALEFLRSSSRNAENRARLASLQGVLGLYEDTQVAGLVCRDSRKAAVVGAFSRLLSDDLYDSLSTQSFALGIPTRAKLAVETIRRLSSQLLEKAGVKQLFDLGSKGASIATQLPLPTSEQAAELLGKDPFLPPLVDVYGPVQRAHAAFQSLTQGSRN
jgi:hypothetical protein